MNVRLVGTMVKTDVADYPCATREEAEALYLQLRDRGERHGDGAGDDAPEQLLKPGSNLPA